MSYISKEKYHISIRVLHWLMALIIISLIAVGWYMTGLDRDDPIRAQLYNLHKSFGVTILFLVVLRLVLRIIKGAPALPTSIPALVRKFAHGIHYILYILMFAIPVSGYMMSNMYGLGVKWFDINMPRVFPPNRQWAEIANEAHEILAYILLVLIILHIAGAIKHRFEKNPKNDVLRRML